MRFCLWKLLVFRTWRTLFSDLASMPSDTMATHFSYESVCGKDPFIHQSNLREKYYYVQIGFCRDYFPVCQMVTVKDEAGLHSQSILPSIHPVQSKPSQAMPCHAIPSHPIQSNSIHPSFHQSSPIQSNSSIHPLKESIRWSVAC